MRIKIRARSLLVKIPHNVLCHFSLVYNLWNKQANVLRSIHTWTGSAPESSNDNESEGDNNDEEDFNTFEAMCSALRMAEASNVQLDLILDGLDQVIQFKLFSWTNLTEVTFISSCSTGFLFNFCCGWLQLLAFCVFNILIDVNHIL